jgi:AcrR family transcriptional regulator
MAERVKRHYASAVRAEQVRATRRAVVEAARELFVRQGWTATSVEHVAAAAGVSRATVFTVGGKPELLKLAYDTAIGGDDEDVAMADRPAVRELAAAPDLDALVARYVALVVATGARVAGIYVALRAAADADERVRALFADVQAQRLTGATGFVATLTARGWLRPGLEPEVAADVLWTLLDPGLYAALVQERGWPRERFAGWWEQALRAQLLAG